LIYMKKRLIGVLSLNHFLTIKTEYPEAAIDVLVEPRSKNAYRICQFVEEVLVFDYQDRNGLADYLNLLGMIRDREYEVAINVTEQGAIGFVIWLNGIPTRIGYKRQGSVFTNYTVDLKTAQYKGLMYHDLVSALGIHKPCPDLKINVLREDIDWAEAEQNRLGLKQTGYILIHSGESKLTKLQGIDKVYPIPKWQRIIEDITRKQSDLPIVLINGPDDDEWTKQLSSLCPQVKICSPPDLGKLSALIAGANLLLCSDSAPMQLAVAVGTYTIALFGPTKVENWLPSNNNGCVGIQSLSTNISDIPTDKILEKVWQN